VRRVAYRGFIRKPEEKEPLGRHRRRRGNNIKVELQEVSWYMDGLYPAQKRGRWRFL
jgi:hypothetical protein